MGDNTNGDDGSGQLIEWGSKRHETGYPRRDKAESVEVYIGSTSDAYNVLFFYAIVLDVALAASNSPGRRDNVGASIGRAGG